MMRQQSSGDDVAMREPIERPRDMEGICAHSGEIIERVVPIARAFARQYQPHLPVLARHPEQLSLAEKRLTVVHSIAGRVVFCVTVASGKAETNTQAQRIRQQRRGNGRADISQVVIAVDADHASRPVPQGGPGTRDTDQTADGVASKQRSLRSAHELDLLHVQQFDV